MAHKLSKIMTAYVYINSFLLVIVCLISNLQAYNLLNTELFLPYQNVLKGIVIILSLIMNWVAILGIKWMFKELKWTTK